MKYKELLLPIVIMTLYVLEFIYILNQQDSITLFTNLMEKELE